MGLRGYPKPTWVMGSRYDAIAREAAARSGKAFSVQDQAAAFIRFENRASLGLAASWAANIREAELMETRRQQGRPAAAQLVMQILDAIYRRARLGEPAKIDP